MTGDNSSTDSQTQLYKSEYNVIDTTGQIKRFKAQCKKAQI